MLKLCAIITGSPGSISPSDMAMALIMLPSSPINGSQVMFAPAPPPPKAGTPDVDDVAVSYTTE